MLRRALPLFLIALGLSAQTGVMLPESSVKVSDHVYAIMGFPNVAIVVGERATLVVDTGMGARNGAVVMKEVEKLRKSPNLYLTTTHVHAEHTAGEQGFPANTVLLRPTAQQEEMNAKTNLALLDFFRGRPQTGDLLKGVTFRDPDILFDKEVKLDLGGVTARIMLTGGGHTRADTVVFAEPDSTLISGDLVQNKQIPNIPNEDGSVKRWIASVDALALLNPRYVLPDHGPLGDGSLVGQEKAFLVWIQTRALELKQDGKTPEDAGKIILGEFTTKYPGWAGFGQPLNPLTALVRRVYAE